MFFGKMHPSFYDSDFESYSTFKWRVVYLNACACLRGVLVVLVVPPPASTRHCSRARSNMSSGVACLKPPQTPVSYPFILASHPHARIFIAYNMHITRICSYIHVYIYIHIVCIRRAPIRPHTMTGVRGPSPHLLLGPTRCHLAAPHLMPGPVFAV